MAKKELTLKEHLQRIQRKGGKARWEGVPLDKRSAYAKKTVAARWARAKKKPAAKNAAKKTPGPKKLRDRVSIIRSLRKDCSEENRYE